jgi:hypothetical protein
MEEHAIREAQLRRDSRARGMVLKKTRRRAAGSEHGPYHVLEPIRNLAVSATRYPNGMTLDEAETFVTQQ